MTKEEFVIKNNILMEYTCTCLISMEKFTMNNQKGFSSPAFFAS